MWRGEGSGGEVPDIMIGKAIAPGPAAGEVEQGKALAEQQFARLVGIDRRRCAQRRGREDAAAHHRRGIMRREMRAGGRNIGKVGADRDDAPVGILRRSGQTEPGAACARSAGTSHTHAICR